MRDIYTAKGWEEAPAPDVEPIHPGVVLDEEFLKPLGISQSRAASDMGIPVRRIHEIVTGKRSVTAETAILLAKYLRTSPQFWMSLQTAYEFDALRGRMREKLARVRVFPRPDLEESPSGAEFTAAEA